MSCVNGPEVASEYVKLCIGSYCYKIRKLIRP